ncbi:hypothetical protein KIF59_23405 [Enterobacter cloacae subsp. cloacae]|nr:hypothetical protein [Enterobacter cloacae subsp. cloacae]
MAIVTMAGIAKNEICQRACRPAWQGITFITTGLMALGFIPSPGVQL